MQVLISYYDKHVQNMNNTIYFCCFDDYINNNMNNAMFINYSIVYAHNFLCVLIFLPYHLADAQ